MELQDIFLVDDDPDDRNIIQDALTETHGKGQIRYAQDGEAALAMLQQAEPGQKLPCLIVLDLNMPKLNGTQILKILKEQERFKHIPIIIYSTSVNPLEKEKCMALGAHAYIIKPITFTQSIETAKFFLTFCTDKQHT